MLTPSREESDATLAEPSYSYSGEKYVDDRLIFGLQQDRASVPSGWSMLTHPSGWVYFRHAELSVTTDDDIRDPDTFSSLNVQLNSIPALPPRCEVHVHAKSLLRTYVNHERALGGWGLEAVDGSRVDSMDASSLLRLRRMYWAYLQQHPSHTALPSGAEDDLVDFLTTFRTENLMFEQSSPGPFIESELTSLFNVLRSHNSASSRSQSPAKTTFVAWVLRRVYSYKESASHNRHTRKFYDELLLQKQGDDEPLTPSRIGVHWDILNFVLDSFMTIVLWSVPYSYLHHLRSAIRYRGRLSSVQARWEQYIAKLVKEWTDFNLVGIVLLSATVSFLSLSGLGELSTILCMYSILLSLGAVVIGVFCVWKHQTNVRATDSFRYMQNAQSSSLGLRGLAILQSLPLIMLIWAILCFAVSIVIYAFLRLPEEGDVTVASVVLPRSVAGGAILVLCVVVVALTAFSRIWGNRSTRSLLARLNNPLSNGS